MIKQSLNNNNNNNNSKELFKTIPILTSIDLLSSSSSLNLTNNECLFNDYVIISSDTKFKQLSLTIYQSIQLKINKLNFKIFDCYLIIKNWKPILIDNISLNDNDTVYDILGHLIGIVQLNIRIILKDSSHDFHSQQPQNTMIDQKLLLNTFLYNLQSTQQLNGDLNTYNLYNLYGQLASLLMNNNETQDLNGHRTLDLSGSNKATKTLLTNNTINNQQSNVKIEPLNLTQSSKSSLTSTNGQIINNDNNTNFSSSLTRIKTTSSLKRQRERTTFDPQEEIPRLMQIFDQTHHPTRFQIAAICDTLNTLECRKGKKPLEPYNIQYWFKNSRAALRRKLKIDQNNQEEIDDEEEDDEDEEEEGDYDYDYESSCESIKKEDDYLQSLPNKNAIYIINPQEENSKKIKATTKTSSIDDDDDEDVDDHLSINESENCSNLNLNTNSLSNNANNKTAQQSANNSRRNRIFIDPISEVPILEQYFQRETYPDHYLIEKICDDLNKGEYRLKFPKLEARNIQLWFKNHRAKLKRLKVLNGNHDKQSTDDSPASN